MEAEIATFRKKEKKWTVKIKKGHRNVYGILMLKSKALSFVHKIESEIT